MGAVSSFRGRERIPEAMFDHVTIRVTDRSASERFYRAALPVLDIPPPQEGDHFVEWDDFSIAEASDDRPPTRGLHIGFVSPSRKHVDDFWQTGTAAGYRDDGPPGPRPQYSDSYYGSFLLDPGGNSAEAVHREGLRTNGNIDHLWIRVADLDASKRFYELVAPHAGFTLVSTRDNPDRARYSGGNGSFSIVDGTPTENVHVAFPATENSAVDAFFESLTGAGYRSNGEPGERPEYHPGYYGAFVLDPDRNNIELVNHNRGS
jgi:catechol 2,3-dioxygenase-like lactoylglutathione lyase family enzyme